MSATARTLIVCEGGHKGFLKFEENDNSSGNQWETYSVEGFSGGVLTTSHAGDTKDMLAMLQLTCPECGKTGKVTYAK